jgi:hypothetical protein
MLLDAFEAARIKTSVMVNGLAIPFDKVTKSLIRFCRPLLIRNDHDTCDLGVMGSSFLVTVRGHNLLLCSRHQLGVGKHLRKPDDIVIVVKDRDDKDVALTCNEAVHIEVNPGEDPNAEDLLMLRFDTQRGNLDLSQLFLKWNLDDWRDLDTVSPDKIVAIIAIGFMTASNSFDPVYTDEYELVGAKVITRWSQLSLRLTEPGPWVPRLRIGLEVHQNMREATAENPDYDPDGFSGSPVMFIFKDDGDQHHLCFAGLITHADKFGRFAIYRASHTRQAVLQLVGHE